MSAAFDAVTPDTESGAGVTTLTSGSWTIAGADRCLIGFNTTGDSSAASHTGMDHPAAGGALTAITGSNLAISTHARISGWRLIAPAAASNTTKGTWGASQGEAGIAGLSYTGVDQTTPVDLASVATATGNVTGGTSATATVNVATTAGDMVIACAFMHIVSTAVGPTATEGAGCTPRYDLEGGSQMGGWGSVMVVERVASGSSTTMSVDFAFSSASGDWGIVAFKLNAAAAAGPANDIKIINRGLRPRAFAPGLGR